MLGAGIGSVNAEGNRIFSPFSARCHRLFRYTNRFSLERSDAEKCRRRSGLAHRSAL